MILFINDIMWRELCITICRLTLCLDVKITLLNNSNESLIYFYLYYYIKCKLGKYYKLLSLVKIYANFRAEI